MPTGAPNLWPDRLSATSPDAPRASPRHPANETGTCATAPTASRCSGTRASAAAAASAAASCTVPTSLLTTRAVASAAASASDPIASAKLAGAIRPTASRPTGRTTAPCVASQAAVSRVAWCSPSGSTMAPVFPGRSHQRPFRARLIDSVPPPVNTTSIGWQSRRAATSSRASSSTLRAACPDPCTDDALPTSAVAAIQASRAAGRSGVEAA